MASPLFDLASKVIAGVRTTCSCLFLPPKPLPHFFLVAIYAALISLFKVL